MGRDARSTHAKINSYGAICKSAPEVGILEERVEFRSLKKLVLDYRSLNGILGVIV